MLSVGLCAQIACVWEATARKPGNVHRFADFHDCTYLDFLLSAAAVAPVLERARERRVGETVRECVRATRSVTGSNTNLGIVLLLAPLAAVPEGDLQSGVERVLTGLSVEDAGAVYEAIRLASPGGLGEAAEQDVRSEPTVTLREAMALAADRDLVARQYANGFREVFDLGLPALVEGMERTGDAEAAIIACQLAILAEHPDSLVARKCGLAVAEEASRRARDVLTAGLTPAALAELDAWLRDPGHRRNPGTTADLVTASVFVALRQEKIALPVRWLSLSASRSSTGRPS